MGRPTLLTDLVAQAIVSAVEKGATRDGAAKSARVGKSTLLEWTRRGRDGEMPYAALVDRMREAEGKLQVEMVTKLLGMARSCEHPPTQLKALETMLTRLGWTEQRPAAAKTVANEQRDPVADLDVVRATLRALESRAKVA